MLASLLLFVFCIGGILLIASVFRGEFRMLGQVIRTDDAGTLARFIGGIVGIALVLAAGRFLPSGRPDLILPGFCALGFGGALAFIAAVRGRFSASGVLLDGEAVGGFARGFAGLAALLFAGFGLQLLLGKTAGTASAHDACAPGFRSQGTACVPINPTTTSVARTASNSNDMPRPVPTAWHSQTYIQLASERIQDDANERADREAQRLNRKVCVFESKKSTAFGIALGPLSKQEALDSLPNLKANGVVPNDAFVAPIDDSQIRSCYPLTEARPL
jgi:hypothetical protein